MEKTLYIDEITSLIILIVAIILIFGVVSLFHKYTREFGITLLTSIPIGALGVYIWKTHGIAHTIPLIFLYAIISHPAVTNITKKMVKTEKFKKLIYSIFFVIWISILGMSIIPFLVIYCVFIIFRLQNILNLSIKKYDKFTQYIYEHTHFYPY